jgi:hypothetical protein
MKNINIAIILFIESGVVLVGLLNGWKYDTWKNIDVMIILLNIFLGLMLIKSKHLKIFKFLKTKLFIFSFIVLAVLSIIALVVLGYVSEKEVQRKAEDRKCKFSIVDVVENRYEEDREASNLNLEAFNKKGYKPVAFRGLFSEVSAVHKTYWEIDGLLKNKIKRQYLDGIVLKIYTSGDKNILLTGGYYDVKEWLEAEQSLPFQVRANIDREDELLAPYFEKGDDVRIDVYPYYSFCNY